MQEIIKKYNHRKQSSLNEIKMAINDYTRIISYFIIDKKNENISEAINLALIDYPNIQEFVFLHHYINNSTKKYFDSLAASKFQKNILQLSTAIQLLQNNNISVAQDFFIKTYQNTATHLKSFILYSILYIYSDINSNMCYLFHLKLKRIAETEIAYSYLADYFMQKKQYESVIGIYDKLIDINPFNASYWKNMAFSYRLIGYNESCITACNLALSILKKNPETLILKSEALIDSKRFIEAQYTYNQIAQLYPTFVDNNFKKNNLLITLELKQYDKALKLIQTLDMTLLSSIKICARYYYETEQFDESLNIIKNYMKLNSSDYNILNLLGNTYLQIAENHIDIFDKESCLAEALNAYTHSLELNISQENIQYQKGYTHFLKHEYSQALNYLLKTIKSEVSDSQSNFLLSVCYYHLNNKQKSEEYYRLAQAVENIHDKFLYYCPDSELFLKTIIFK